MKPAAQTIIAELSKQRKDLHRTSMRDLFAVDADRFDRFSLRLGETLFDYSKSHVDEKTIQLLLKLATAAGVEEARSALFAGEHINLTEDRAVMHMALRNLSGKPRMVDGHDVMVDVESVLERMRAFSEGIRVGELTGKGGAFTDIVNIGIGGSDLGPVMVSEALRPYCDGPKLHFVSNVDGADITDALSNMNPATTLFIVASKTFTTQETMTNAATARDWLVAKLGEDAVGQHFVALSTNLEATGTFGILEDKTFGFWNWVGGRYSVWSAIGLSVMIGIGWDNFEAFLQGAHMVDRHFETEPLADNIPVIMALLGIWHRNVCNYPTHAILPYAQHLHRLAAYLQQLDMESNGKRICRDGTSANCKTGPVVWGEPGTNGQHAFYQLLHQGTDIIPADFLLAANPHHDLIDNHQKLVANCLAQGEALMRGKTVGEAKAELLAEGASESEANRLALHKVFPGNRPSNTFLFAKLTPQVLGTLIALYEHKIFVQGVIWDINSFDQWGVELGKQLAGELLPLVKDDSAEVEKDSSTKGLLEHYRATRTGGS